MRPYHVAIVGSGPSGYFAAASLLKFADADRRRRRARRHAGDAADSVGPGALRRRARPSEDQVDQRPVREDRRSIRGSGSSATSSVGEHVQAAELAERYDAVIYAVGAQSDRPLGIPGEELPGSVAAVDFVGWYNAHPHFEEMAPDLSTGTGRRGRQRQRRARRGPHPGHRSRRAGHHRHRRPRAASRCTPAASRRCVVIGRRGPLQATFTTLELRELGDLEGLGDVDVIVDPADFADITDEDLEAAGKTVKQQHQGAARVRRTRRREGPSAASCSGSARRRSRSGATAGSSRSCSAATNWSTTDGRVVGQGHRRARGAARPAGGPRGRLPRRADAGAAVRRTDGHHPAHRRPDRRQPQRVRRRLDQARPVGRDRQQQEATRRRPSTPWSPTWPTRTLADFGEDHSEELGGVAAVERQPKLVTDDHWKLIDDHERGAGGTGGRPRVKLTSVAELLRIGHG